MYEKIKKFYNLGLWTEDMVRNAVDKGIITEDECESIVNGNRKEKYKLWKNLYI